MYFHTLLLEILVAIASVLPATDEQGKASKAGEDRLQELLSNVNANEALYDKIEIIMIKEMKRGESSFKRPEHLKYSKTKTRTVYQSNMFYNDYDQAQTTVAGTAVEVSHLEGYDGERTRVLTMTNNAIGNIHEDRFEGPLLVRPHTLILGRARVDFPFSLYLHAGPELKNHRSAGIYKNINVKIIYEKEEKVQNLHCLKIRVETGRDKAEISVYRYIWLADERNYIPIKSEAFIPSWNSKVPAEVGIVDDLREISPGVWFPYHAVIRVYDTKPLKEGKQVLANSDEFTVEKVALNPNYDISLFRDITFPDGIPVYVIKNGKIVRSYYQNGARPRFQSKSRRWWYIGASLAGAALIGSGLYLLRRKRRSFHER